MTTDGKEAQIEEKNKEILEENHFEKLTPFVEADISKYEEMLDFALADVRNEDITNIAMTGLYGSGKSSVIETYKKKKKKSLKFLSISLSHYDGTNDINTKELEGKIVNQLLHQINHKRIPKTIFKAKSNTSKFTIISYALGFIVLSGLIYGWFNKMTYIKSFLVKNFPNDSLENVLINGWFDAFWILIIGIVLFIFVHKIVGLQTNEKLIKALTVNGNSVEILEESKESYFDKFMNDVIYLFANSGADVIVFEDLDRFKDLTIYEKLQEINILANKQMVLDKNFSRLNNWIFQKIPVIKKKKLSRKLAFLYLIRDDAFESKDRTKFFDFIIPIVPTMDGSNSYTKFIEIFRRMKIDKDFEESLLKKLSLYIDDYRLLKNVANEYFAYEGRINSSKNSLDLDKNKLLALVIYKNLFPKDFSELQYGKSYLNAILSQKNVLINEKQDEIKSEIAEVVDEINQAESELFETVDELDALYLKTPVGSEIMVGEKNEHGYDNRAKFIRAIKDSEYLVKQKTKNSYYFIDYNIKSEFDSLVDDEIYSSRRSNIENKSKTSHEKLLARKQECEARLNEAQSTSIRDLLFTQPDTFFDGIISNSEIISSNKKNIKDERKFSYLQKSDYFPLLKFLVREELIDEKYNDYMTYFYDGDLSKNDRVFIRSIYDFRPKEFSYSIDNPEKVISEISKEDFARYGIRNLDLAVWILRNNDSQDSYYTHLVENLKKKHDLDFLYEFYEKSKANNQLGIFFKNLHEKWSEFIIVLIEESSKIDKLSKLRYVSDYLKEMNYHSISSIGDLKTLVQYINNSDILSIGYLPNKELLKLLPKLEKLKISFSNIFDERIDLTVIKEIVRTQLFEITEKNVKAIIRSYDGDISNEDFFAKNYTSINSLNNAEINRALFSSSRFSLYLKQYLGFGSEELSDNSEDVLEILNSKHVKDEDKSTYISRLSLNPQLESISEVENRQLWQGIINKRNLTVSSENILNLLEENEWILGKELAEYINTSSKSSIKLDLQAVGEEEMKKIFRSVVTDINLKDGLYISLLKSMNRVYNNGIPDIIPSVRIKSLVENRIITFSNKNLESIRQNHSGELVDFILISFDEYIDEIQNEEDDNHDGELVSLLQTNRFSVEQSKQMIDNIKETISVNYPYDNEIKKYIVENAFDENDLEYLLNDYTKFDKGLADTVYALISHEEYLDKIINNKKILLKELLNLLLLDLNIDTETRNKIILNNINSIEATDLQKYSSVPQEFLSVLQRKKVRIPNTDLNKRFAKIYQEKNWVTTVDDSEGVLTIQGKKVL